ncbi:hypothetical protein GQ42DRAFT_181862 [Ramicandelaber brevisporus]|nr:hypothetical protein GQ42DRAFT_181862 [Ramicandelaber brevisporus]
MTAKRNPFSLLFRLPRELQELITEFFARWEAVPLLTVNRALHELFVERIWRRLDKDIPSYVSIPPEALKTYGHLVRHFDSYQNVTMTDDLLSTFPNLTHLRLPFYELKEAVVTARGKPLERLQHLGFSSYKERSDIPETTVNRNPAIKWLNRQVDNCTGKLTIEWETYGAFDLQLSPKLVSWLKSQSEKAHIRFTIDTDVLDFGDASYADTNNLLLRYLTELGIGTGDENCGAAGLGRLLATRLAHNLTLDRCSLLSKN